MPGTTTRLNRVRSSAGSLRRAGRTARPARVVLRDKHVALLGADVSAHVTGFAGFTESLGDLLAERTARLSRPLAAGHAGHGRPAGPTGSLGSAETVATAEPCAAPDLVVTVLPGPGAAGAAVELADRHDVPLLVVVQAETLPPAPDAATPGARLASRLEDRALRRADRWAVTGKVAADRLADRGVDPDRIEPLPYWAPGVPVGQVADAERMALRRCLGLPGGFLVVCPVGADSSGPATVIGAAHVLASRDSDVRLVLLGRGRRLRAMPGSAWPSTLSVVEVDDDGYRTAMTAADLVLLSESATGWDGANAGRLAAGLAAGRPMIGALEPEGHLSAELSRAEAAVITVPPQQPRLLADAIDVLAGAPQARAVMAAGARHYTRDFLGPGTAAATLEAIAARTLSRPAGSSWWGRNR